MKMQLKEEFKDFEIAYNGKHAPLGERDDLDKFLIIAHRANRQDYLNMFNNPPTLNDLLTAEANKKLEGGAGVYSPHPLHVPEGTPVIAAAPATDQAQVNVGETTVSGDAGTTGTLGSITV